MKQDNFDSKLPSRAQIDAEIKEAEAEGIHEEPIDLLDEACEAEVISGHADELFKPTIEDLTR